MSSRFFATICFTAALAASLCLGLLRLMPLDKQRDNFPHNSMKTEAVQCDITALKPGRIKQMHVRPGEAVRTGQVVARIDTQHLDTQLQENRLALLNAQAAMEETQAQLALFLRTRPAMSPHRHDPPVHISVNDDLWKYITSLSSSDEADFPVLNNPNIVIAQQKQRWRDIVNAR